MELIFLNSHFFQISFFLSKIKFLRVEHVLEDDCVSFATITP